jgi:predicted ribosome quality control (RQC) complex YloA/Tae2 family protein
MALDGAFLYAIRQEMLGLIGARIEKIHQPAREEILLSLRNMEGSHKVLISVSADRARVHLTEQSIDNPAAPPMFCMLLRKRLGNGKLLAIRQNGLERVLYFDFSCVNTLGDVVQLTLACEVMGKYSNLILIDENGTVIDSLKRVDAEMSRKRLVLPGIAYALPPAEPRLNFLTAERETLKQAITSQSGALHKVLLQTLEGVSPVLVREWAFYAGHGTECRAETLTDDQTDRLLYIIQQTKERLLQENPCFTIAATKEGQLKDFSFLPLHQFGTLLYTRTMPSACALLDYFYAERDRYARVRQRANDLFHLLLHATERIQRRIAAQTAELEQCAEKDALRRKADLLSANLYRLKKGDHTATLEDFYEPDCPSVTISLDVRLTPAQNAQYYYQLYKKSCTAEKVLTEQIEKGNTELTYLESVLDALTRAETETDLEQLRQELTEQGYLRRANRNRRPVKIQQPLQYTASDGTPIFVGRNNLQNDRLTLKTAAKTDIWLHTQNIPGSHVILATNGATPSDQVILEAAQLAAWHSKAQQSTQVPVDYCLVKYVKKPVGAKPGMVIFKNQKTLYVTPSSPDTLPSTH